MPFYDYFCEANGKTVEVFHPMKVRLKTWAAVCLLARIDPGKTPPTSPVVRLISGEPTTWQLKGLDKDDPGKKMEL